MFFSIPDIYYQYLLCVLPVWNVWKCTILLLYVMYIESKRTRDYWTVLGNLRQDPHLAFPGFWWRQFATAQRQQFLGVNSNNRGKCRQMYIPVILHFLYFQPYDAMKLFLACMREDENGDPKIKLLFENCLQRKKYFRLFSSSVRLFYALITVSVMMVFNQAFLN